MKNTLLLNIPKLQKHLKTTPHIKNKMIIKNNRAAAPLAVVAAFCLICGGCRSAKPATSTAAEPVPHLVTGDIQAGIEAHIENQTQLGNGYFNLDINGTNHQLRLVRIHTEYLATLAPHEHFACIDLVDTKGDVYDVDFFMHGDPGNMQVTKTMPHKLNGKPFYFWQQNDDGHWVTVPADQASQKLMGIIVPDDRFEFRYNVTLPKITGKAALWLPLPQTDDFQTVAIKSIHEPQKHRVLTEKKFGNRLLYWELGPEDGGKNIDIRYDVQRIEKSAYVDNNSNPSDFLSAERLVPAKPQFRDIAQEVTRGKKSDLQRARALYDHVIEEVRYAKAGDGWGEGNAEFACDAKHGNCTDFHAYFIALARAVNIPARFAIGAAIPSNRSDGGVDGYHCWVEFHADGKWWPVDISEADKYTALSTYYFGHHPANRLEFSRGRDLEVTPGPASGPINFLAYPILEVDGLSVKAPVRFSFHRAP